MFANRHKHDWRIQAQQFNPPRPGKATGLNQETYMRMLYGVTVITYACETCPELRHTHVTGRTAEAQ